MWAKDDDIRRSLKRMNQAAHECVPTVSDCRNLATAAVLPALNLLVLCRSPTRPRTADASLFRGNRNITCSDLQARGRLRNPCKDAQG
jgi:hypothetical protein